MIAFVSIVELRLYTFGWNTVSGLHQNAAAAQTASGNATIAKLMWPFQTLVPMARPPISGLPRCRRWHAPCRLASTGDRPYSAGHPIGDLRLRRAMCRRPAAGGWD